ncbi:MAG TPA: hypothetical protein VGG25_19130 [Streptosporangiaceae bacterium]|jgi:hypothetical protein
MIATVQRHRRVAAALREFLDQGGTALAAPRLIAGTVARQEDSRRGGSRPGDPGGCHLAEWLEEPLSRPGGRPARAVWHCTIQPHPDDRCLSDQEWASVAAAIIHGTGLSRAGETGAVRWLAARHCTHIHVLATLARQDGGAVLPGSDFSPVRRACHAAEDSYGLRSTRLTAPGPVLRRRHPGGLACHAVPQPAPVREAPQ